MKAKLLDDGDYRVSVTHEMCSIHVGTSDVIYSGGVRMFITMPVASASQYLSVDEAEALRDALSIVIEKIRDAGDA